MKRAIILLVIAAITAALVFIAISGAGGAINWGLLSTFLMLGCLSLFIWHTGRRPLSTLAISITATMAALASLGRILLAGLVNVQPATFLILLSGYVFGSGIGFLVGILTGLVSNFFLGQGPWTPWQMAAWGLCGWLGGLAGRGQDEFKKVPFLIISVFSAYLFGLMMNTWHWAALVYPLTWATWLATCAASLLFDTFHAVGNVFFALIFGPPFFRHLLRFRHRFPNIYDPHHDDILQRQEGVEGTDTENTGR